MQLARVLEELSELSAGCPAALLDISHVRQGLPERRAARRVVWTQHYAPRPTSPKASVMPMSDSGAFSGAMMLSQQLSMYRWMDTIERAWSNNELAVDNALLRREAAEIVVSYNQLVADFNDLRGQAIEVAQEADRRGSAIAELQHEGEALRRAKDTLEAECERLRQENKEKGIEITFLRETLRDQHPDRYPRE